MLSVMNRIPDDADVKAQVRYVGGCDAILPAVVTEINGLMIFLILFPGLRLLYGLLLVKAT